MNIAIRCYQESAVKPQYSEFERYFNQDLVFVFDFETTADMYQDMTFGCCGMWENGKQTDLFLVHSDKLTKKQIGTLQEYATNHKTALITRKRFVELFYEYVFTRRAVCVGFNLPFDISRVATGYGTSKKDKRAFSFKLSDNRYEPRITIKHINSKSSFIGFTRPLSKNRREVRKYAGTFVDLKTLTFALTNKSHTLKSACELFGTPHKKLDTEGHGKVTPEYIKYNINDVLATYDLYAALSKEFEAYNLDVPLNSLYSPASIGKAYLKTMGIKPFLEQNPDFPKSMLGYLMSTYYGGRSEVHIRKQLVPVTYLDFRSMYPTMFELMDLWPFVVAESVFAEEDNTFQWFLDDITVDDLRDKNAFKKLNGIALVDADDDIFPVRAKYGSKKTYNIGINRVTGQLYYTYADIVASKLLTGRAPKILKAWRFRPVGVQKGLKPITLFGSSIDPSKESFIKALIEHRLKTKERLKVEKDNEELKTQEHIAKIIANSSSYGISAETNPIPTTRRLIDVYGLKSFEAHVEKDEQHGKAFNPIIATLITSGARLVLAAVENRVSKDRYFAYCDTDGIFVNPESVKGIQTFFKSLNPYNLDVEMFKIEVGDDKKPLENVLFYGISAKRYCLMRRKVEDIDDTKREKVIGKGNKAIKRQEKQDKATRKERIEIVKHSSHGLGHLRGMPDNWEKEFWVDIVRYNEGKKIEEEINDKYKDNVVLSQLSVTSPDILKRFKKGFTGEIKPFNFISIGVRYRLDNVTREPVIPSLPFTNDTNTIKYMPFVDYKTGKYYDKDTQFYWKPISELFFDYIDHKEEKYDGEVGILRRKSVVVDGIIYIGKESNNLEESEVIGVSDDDYVVYSDRNEENVFLAIKKMSYSEAKKLGIGRTTLYYLKKRVKEGKKVRMKEKTLRRLLSISV